MKKLILVIVALIVVVPMVMKNNHSNANSKWHNNVPTVLQQKGTWQSQLKPIKNSKQYKYVNYSLVTNNHNGIDPIQEDYNANKKNTMSGCASSAYACINPHYENLGNNWFKLTSGGVSNPNHPKYTARSLYYELHQTLNHSYGGTWLIHIHNNHNLSLWGYGEHNQKIYYGNFSKTNN